MESGELIPHVFVRIREFGPLLVPIPSDACAAVRHKRPTTDEAVAARELDGNDRHRDRDAEAEQLIVECKHALPCAAETRGAQVHEDLPGQQGFDPAAKDRATRAAEHGVKAAVEKLKATWPASVQVTFTQDKSKIIRQMLADLQNSVATGVLLVAVIILFALGFRASLFIGIAIPASFLAGVLGLQLAGLTINIVVLFSLILAVGMLVDDAIIVSEFAERRMSEGMPPKEAYSLAAKRMAGPVIAATATRVAAFSPLLFWPGVVGARAPDRRPAARLESGARLRLEGESLGGVAGVPQRKVGYLRAAHRRLVLVRRGARLHVTGQRLGAGRRRGCNRPRLHCLGHVRQGQL